MKNGEKLSWKAWLSLFILIVLFSGVFKDFTGPLKAFDFLNLNGDFGKIYEEINFVGKGGSGAKEGFMTALTIIPAVCLAVGFLDVVEQYGAFKAAEKLFNPILKPLIGVPGSAGIAFVSSFTSSDVGAIMTKELYDTNQITDDERTIFTGYQYSASAVILNTINTQAPLLPIVLLPLGGVIGILFLMKILGANLIRLYLKLTPQKGEA